MTFDLTPEQSLLREVVRRFCSSHCGFEARRDTATSVAGISSHWQRFADMGWLGLGLPEDVGGTPASASDHALLFEEFGRALVVEPYLSCVSLGSRVVQAAGYPAQRKRFLIPMVRGEQRIALAHNERQVGTVNTLAHRDATNRWVLNGRKEVVLDGTNASILVISARRSVSAGEPDALILFAVDGRDERILRRSYRTLDGMNACDIVLQDLRLKDDAVLGEAQNSAAAICSGLEQAIISACAEMLGAMDGLLWLTRDYLRERRQYGSTLASMQALQHRLAEMFAEVELSRSMVHRGLRAMETSDRQTRSPVLFAVKSYLNRSSRMVGETAIQLHGGMGMAADYKASHYFKRLIVLSSLFNSLPNQISALEMGASDFHLYQNANFSS